MKEVVSVSGIERTLIWAIPFQSLSLEIANLAWGFYMSVTWGISIYLITPYIPFETGVRLVSCGMTIPIFVNLEHIQSVINVVGRLEETNRRKWWFSDDDTVFTLNQLLRHTRPWIGFQRLMTFAGSRVLRGWMGKVGMGWRCNWGR